MDKDKKAYLDDELTDEDLAVLRLYEAAAEPVPWDESDDAILAMAHSAAPQAQNQAQDDATLIPGVNTPAAGTSRKTEAATGADEAENEKVVAFKPRQGFSVRRVLQSPAAGFAMAACLVLGLFAGQGLSPYVNLGVGPDYRGLQEENSALRQQAAATRSITASTGEKADLERLTGFLAGFSCADLSLTVSQGRGVRVAGHVGSVNDLRRLNVELAKLGNVEEMTRYLRVYDWPICEALEVVAPYGGVLGSGSIGPSLRLDNHGLSYKAGERLVVEVAAGAADGGYLYVDYFQHDGQVRHMLPTRDLLNNRLQPGQSVVLGDGGQSYIISPPFGTELVMVVQSPLPIFGPARPELERAQDYLNSLRQALNGLVARGRGDDIAIAYKAITSHGDNN